MTAPTLKPLNPQALARLRATVQQQPGAPAAQTIQMLLDEIDRLKAPQPVSEWDPYAECPLTRRQLQLLVHIANGLSTTEISTLMGIGPTPVRLLKQRALRRLGIHSATAAVAVCLINGWMPARALHLPGIPRPAAPAAASAPIENRAWRLATYQERAQHLRETPGTWGDISVHATRSAAKQSAYRLRSGKHKFFRPAGLWEAHAFSAGSVHCVRARYIGTIGDSDS
ncbi:response regulator transcription factor [Streptomyces sp. NPDC094153]|uniref:response regulator transcription factor n=1 Tax=Streptomyces sp. NPDC094153 TaxID=3366058 RepID=UPI00382B13A7